MTLWGITMTFAILLLFIIQLILPAVLIISLGKGSFHSKLDWIIKLFTTGMFTIWIFYSGRWDWISYYFRFFWLVAFIIAALQSWKKARPLPFIFKFSRKQKVTMAIYSVLLLVFAIYNNFVFRSHMAGKEAIELSFPLHKGTYYVAHGGNHVQMNYHNAYPPQKYALDIVKLNTFGMRSNGIYPKQLERYMIYGDELMSPCTGKVLEVRNDAPDQIPPNMDAEKPEGNYVALLCDNEEAVVYIAHMQKGSVAAKEGSVAKEGQLIGLVGNSGNTTEPHLHIHAEKDGEGVPIKFNGKFLVRNNIVRVR
jgi:hypothetical protein